MSTTQVKLPNKLSSRWQLNIDIIEINRILALLRANPERAHEEWQKFKKKRGM